MYDDDEFLALSGIQHYAFCRRQWGLIHIDQVWNDNLLTVQGNLMHERAHNEQLRERRGNTLTVRGLWVRSPHLGVNGACDVVEFTLDPAGHPLAGEDGLWLGMPVEYKHGQAKATDVDRLQLCAQAMCLEEMFACDITCGCLYYGKTHSREYVDLSPDLRRRVEKLFAEMHGLYARGHVPKVRKTRACSSCSLLELCMPKVETASVEHYLAECLGGD